MTFNFYNQSFGFWPLKARNFRWTLLFKCSLNEFSLSLVCRCTDLTLKLWRMQLNISFGVDANARPRIVWHNLQLTAFSADWGSTIRSNNRLNKHFSFLSVCGLTGEPVLKCLSWVTRADYLLRVHFIQKNPLIVSLTLLTIALYEHDSIK